MTNMKKEGGVLPGDRLKTLLLLYIADFSSVVDVALLSGTKTF